MSADVLFTWMMVFLRGLGLMLIFPTLGTRPLPAPMRAAGAVLLASLLYPLVAHAPFIPEGNLQLITTAAGEVILGMVMGFVGRLTFSAVEMAGRVITQEIGLTVVPGIDAPDPTSEPLAAFFVLFAGVMFFLMGAHLGALSAFARSFDFAPAGAPAFNGLAVEHMIAGTGRVIELGFRIAAPFIAMNFLITLAFSVLGKVVPKMGVFVMSFPLRTVIGCVLLAGSGGLVARYLAPEFEAMPFRILEMVARGM